jgi:Phage tail lysozyme
MTSQHKVMALSGQAIRMMDSDSPTARADAKKFLIDKIYGDQGLNLSMNQRHQAVTTAMGLMEARSAENKALIDANKAQVQTLLTNLHSTQPYNPIAVNDAVTNAAKIGDAESYYKLTFAKIMHDWSDTVRVLPLPQQVAALRSLDTARLNTGTANDAMGFFMGRGYSREQAAGIVGNLIQESNLNPNTIHDNGTGLGIAGHRLERLDGPNGLRAFAAARGKPANDFQTQLEFVDHELQTTEGATGAALKAARTPQEAARAFIGFERPRGYGPGAPLEGVAGYSGRVSNAEALAGGITGPGRAWFEEARLDQVNRTRDYLKGQASDYVDTVVKMLNKAGDVPDGVLKNVADVLHETGQDDQRAKIEKALMAHYGVQDLDKLPESMRRAWVVQTGQESRDSVIASQVHDQMAANIEATAKAMRETPYTTYAARTRSAPPAAYNFDDPQSVAAVAKARAGTQAAFTANDRTAPVSVFEGKEGDAFANVLTNGDAGVAAQSLGGLSGLPTDIYHATLSQKPVADAITGMMGSKDPVRMTAAMQSVDRFWRDSPAGAEAAFKETGITKMQAWQGLRGQFDARETAEAERLR